MQKEKKVDVFDKISLINPTEVFSFFRKHWEPENLKSYKGAKAIFIDNLDKAFAIYDIPSNRKDIPLYKSNQFEINSKRLFEVAKSIDAKSLIIAENFLADEIDVDEKRFQMISNLKREANLRGLEIEDFMSIFSHGYSSLKKLLVE